VSEFDDRWTAAAGPRDALQGEYGEAVTYDGAAVTAVDVAVEGTDVEEGELGQDKVTRAAVVLSTEDVAEPDYGKEVVVRGVTLVVESWDGPEAGMVTLHCVRPEWYEASRSGYRA